MKQETGQNEESEVTIGESNIESTTSESTTTTTVNNSSITGDILMHLQAMITLLRPNDTIILAVKLFSYVQDRVRYLVIVETRSNVAATATSTSRSSMTLNRQSTTLNYSSCDESALLGLELTAIPSTSDDENDADSTTQIERLVFFSTWNV